MMYLTWFRFSLESSSLFQKMDLILLQMAQKESKSSFQKCRFLASQVSRGILLAIFQQYLTEILTLRSSKFNSSINQKGILQILHSQPGVIFQFLQFLHTFFSLKYRLGWVGFNTVVLFISFLLIRDIFFFSFSSFSISSSGYSLLKRIGWQPLLYSCSSSISRYSGVFCLVWVLMCCMICDNTCYFSFYAQSEESERALTNSRANSLAETLSLERSQSNLSFITVFSSRGMSMSIETSFLSSVRRRRPSFGRFSRQRWRSYLLQGSIRKGITRSAPMPFYSAILYILQGIDLFILSWRQGEKQLKGIKNGSNENLKSSIILRRKVSVALEFQNDRLYDQPLRSWTTSRGRQAARQTGHSPDISKLCTMQDQQNTCPHLVELRSLSQSQQILHRVFCFKGASETPEGGGLITGWGCDLFMGCWSLLAKAEYTILMALMTNVARRRYPSTAQLTSLI